MRTLSLFCKELFLYSKAQSSFNSRIMKISALLSIVLLTVASGCLRKEHLVVESDYSYRGNFKRYNSFCFAKVAQADGDSSMNNPVLASAIKSRMELQGYKLTQKKPSL